MLLRKSMAVTGVDWAAAVEVLSEPALDEGDSWEELQPAREHSANVSANRTIKIFFFIEISFFPPRHGADEEKSFKAAIIET